jgi:hypothetical protein
MRKAVAVLVIFVVVFVTTGFLPLITLRKDASHILGQFPLWLVWYPSRPRNWLGMELHLLMSLGVTAFCMLFWQLRLEKWRVDLQDLTIAITLIAIVIGIMAALHYGS